MAGNRESFLLPSTPSPTHDGQVWFTSSGTNVLIRYSPDKASYTFFRLPLPESGPFGLALNSAGKLWFTAGVGSPPTMWVR